MEKKSGGNRSHKLVRNKVIRVSLLRGNLAFLLCSSFGIGIYFLMGWLLVLDVKECLVECATLCVKIEVMLYFMFTMLRFRIRSLVV